MRIVTVPHKAGGHFPLGFIVPAGAEIYWLGLAADVPYGYEIDSAAEWIRGGDTATDTTAGYSDPQHGHDQQTTAEAGSHSHSVTGGSVSATTSRTGAASGSDATVAPGGHTHSITGTMGLSGAHSHTISYGSGGDYPLYARYYVLRATEDRPCPFGGIVMWNASQGELPAQFKVCDGANGTPDLRERFVWAAKSDAHVGATGGANTHTHQATVSAAGGHGHLSLSLTPSRASTAYAGVLPQIDTTVAPDGHGHSGSGQVSSVTDHVHTLADLSADHNPPYLYLYFAERTA